MKKTRTYIVFKKKDNYTVFKKKGIYLGIEIKSPPLKDWSILDKIAAQKTITRPPPVVIKQGDEK